MERINTEDGLFHEGNPSTGQKGTKVTADWLNAIQEEVLSWVNLPVRRDATEAQVFVDIVAANNPAARIMVISKSDDSINPVTVRPAAGTVCGLALYDIDIPSAVMIAPDPGTNDWYKI